MKKLNPSFVRCFALAAVPCFVLGLAGCFGDLGDKDGEKALRALEIADAKALKATDAKICNAIEAGPGHLYVWFNQSGEPHGNREDMFNGLVRPQALVAAQNAGKLPSCRRWVISPELPLSTLDLVKVKACSDVQQLEPICLGLQAPPQAKALGQPFSIGPTQGRLLCIATGTKCIVAPKQCEDVKQADFAENDKGNTAFAVACQAVASAAGPLGCKGNVIKANARTCTVSKPPEDKAPVFAVPQSCAEITPDLFMAAQGTQNFQGEPDFKGFCLSGAKLVKTSGTDKQLANGTYCAWNKLTGMCITAGPDTEDLGKAVPNCNEIVSPDECPGLDEIKSSKKQALVIGDGNTKVVCRPNKAFDSKKPYDVSANNPCENAPRADAQCHPVANPKDDQALFEPICKHYFESHDNSVLIPGRVRVQGCDNIRLELSPSDKATGSGESVCVRDSANKRGGKKGDAAAPCMAHPDHGPNYYLTTRVFHKFCGSLGYDTGLGASKIVKAAAMQASATQFTLVPKDEPMACGMMAPRVMIKPWADVKSPAPFEYLPENTLSANICGFVPYEQIKAFYK